MNSESEAQRVSDALRKARDVESSLHVKYLAYVDGLGAAIVANGLGQALAAERGRADEKAHAKLFKNVTAWLMRPGGPYAGETGEFLDRLVNSDQTTYLRAQMESLAWLDWHKKFCHAYMKKSENE